MASRSRHDVIVIGGEDRRDKQRIEVAAQEAAAALESELKPGSAVDITFRKPGRYQMATLSDELKGWFDTAPVHIVVSVPFLGFFPRYNLTPVAKDAFWTVVGRLAETDASGRYIHMQGTGEIAISQSEIAEACRVSRPTVNGGMRMLMDRAFLWKGRKRAVYQIHPALLYFGSAEKQAEAIGYAKANRKDGELPPIPLPGQELVLLSPKGVKTIIA